MRQLLASLKCLPELVEGKVCIIQDNGYMLCTVPKTVNIQNNYNPLDYCLLNTEKWHNLIVYSTAKEKEHFLVYQQYKRYFSSSPVYRKGDKIHIHSRRGVYEIVDIKGELLEITCKKWQYEENSVHVIHISDFKCLAGGLHNLAI